VDGFKLYEGIDALFDKLEPKIEKEKNKVQDHRRKTGERV
jgi:ribosome-associated translation inhibitor RaiA